MGKKKHNELFFGIQCNEDQQKLRDAILGDDYNVILCDATAGSGKTLIAITCARLLCSDYGYDGAVYVFPTSSEGALGYRPGDTKMKESDYLEPLYDALLKIKEYPSQAMYELSRSSCNAH